MIPAIDGIKTAVPDKPPDLSAKELHFNILLRCRIRRGSGIPVNGSESIIRYDRDEITFRDACTTDTYIVVSKCIGAYIGIIHQVSIDIHQPELDIERHADCLVSDDIRVVVGCGCGIRIRVVRLVRQNGHDELVGVRRQNIHIWIFQICISNYELAVSVLVGFHPEVHIILYVTLR